MGWRDWQLRGSRECNDGLVLRGRKRGLRQGLCIFVLVCQCDYTASRAENYHGRGAILYIMNGFDTRQHLHTTWLLLLLS